MNRIIDRKAAILTRVLLGLGRRLLALILCALMLLTLLPHLTVVYADEGDTQETTPVPASTPVTSVTARISDETAVTAGTAMTNTYMLEVSTGSVKNDGYIDCVMYFVIYYTDEANLTRSTVIFPGKDSMKKGMDAAAQVGQRSARRSRVEEIFGYETPALQSRKGLGNLHMDQYMFSTPTAIKTVDRIQIMGGNPNSSSTWACQAMHIARVDKVYGLDMYGWYSDDGYIDYDGVIIADVVMASGGGIFYWNASANVFNIVGPGAPNGGAGLTLVNTANVATFTKANHVNEHHESQVKNRVLFRLDLADVADAGLECLAGSFAAGANSKISTLKFCEPGCLRVRYVDTYGCVRQVNLPLLINSLGWTMEKLGGSNGGDVAIAGFAQQGDSLPICAMLPDFAKMDYVEITLGESESRVRTHITSVEGAATPTRNQRISNSEKDGIAYLCLAAYRNVAVRIDHDSACIRYSYEPGSEEPAYYVTSSSIEGSLAKAGANTRIVLSPYKENMKLLPGDNALYYMITISTDNVVNAGTINDVYFKITYLNMRDKETTTSEFRLRDYIQRYYGEWPGSTQNFAYNYGLRPGGTVRILMPMSDVKQFQSLSMRVDGADEWQFKGVTIHRVRSYTSRKYTWQEIEADWTNDVKLRSHLLISRDVSCDQDPVFRIGKVYDDGNPMPSTEDPEWEAGTLVQGDGAYHEFDGSSKEISSVEDFNWEDYRYYMTYEDTAKDLGFLKERCNYKVTVNVAGDKTNDDDEDCGSTNLFYFQLLFDYGNSACILANQQIQGDAFRTGSQTVFFIPTTQDYGDLNSIRIIPDDQDDNGDIYDKLKIKSIEVQRISTAKVTPTWTAASDSPDGLGWVGIDYQDPGAAGTYRGTKGRSIEEISHTFEITETSYNTKLLIAISTGNYESRLEQNEEGELVPVREATLAGGMSMSFHYTTHQGGYETFGPIDIVDLMNDFSGIDDKKERTVDGRTEAVDYVVSDPNYQFREGKVDKFYVDVKNIASISDMELQIRSSVGTSWTIDNVSVYVVNGSGQRYINANGEYDFHYPDGEGLDFRCCWDNPETLTTAVICYRPPDSADTTDTAGTGIGVVNISFNENSFPRGTEDWSSKIAREPKSKNDTLNLFIFPSTESAATQPKDYNLTAEILYTDTITQSALRIGTGNMSLDDESSGRPVFYALGLNASYLDGISGVEVKSQSTRPVHAPISYGILQRIRDGVLIDSYYLNGAGNADIGLTLGIDPSHAGQTMQRCFLQINQSTAMQYLTANENDLAVALYFTTDDVYGKELRSKYIYLSDEGYSAIHPGEVIEVDFSIDNIKDIVGINLVSLGRIEVGFENGEILEQGTVGSILHKWSLRGSMSASRSPARFSISGTVSLLDLDLRTAMSDSAIISGTDAPIRMTVGYLDDTNNETFLVYDDIKNYIGDKASFQEGSTDQLRVLVPDMTELRWVKLEPYGKLDPDDPFSVGASWKIESLSAMVDLSGFRVTRMLNKLVVEGEPLTVSLAEILLAGTISSIYDANDTGNLAGDYVIPTGGSLELALNAGEGIRLVPRIQGSKQGVQVVLNRLDPSTGGLGWAELVDTRGYTRELLNEYAAAAIAHDGYEEYAVWNSVQPDVGHWEVRESYDELSGSSNTEAIIFVPPHNYTNSLMCYRITLTSKENEDATVYVDLSVPTEINPVEQLVADARARDEAGMTEHEHSIQFVQRTDPGCETDGNTAYYFCSTCGRYFSDAAAQNAIALESTVIPRLGHNWGAWERYDAESHFQTCTRCGNTQTQVCQFENWTYQDNNKHKGTCPICNNTRTDDCFFQYSSVDATRHKHFCTVCGYVDPNDTQHIITCTDNSPDSANYHTEACTLCQYMDNMVPHNYNSCTSKDESTHIYTCACGHTKEEAHSFTVTVHEPTTTEQGYDEHTCVACGYSYKDNYVDPIPESSEPEPSDPDPTEPTDSTGGGSAQEPALIPTVPLEPNRRKDGDDDGRRTPV